MTESDRSELHIESRHERELKESGELATAHNINGVCSSAHRKKEHNKGVEIETHLYGVPAVSNHRRRPPLLRFVQSRIDPECLQHMFIQSSIGHLDISPGPDAVKEKGVPTIAEIKISYASPTPLYGGELFSDRGSSARHGGRNVCNCAHVMNVRA